MKKRSAIVIISVFILLFLNTTISSLASSNLQNYLGYNVKKKSNLEKENMNPWTPEDEGDHFPCSTEWWFFQSSLELENGSKWDVGTTYEYFTKQNENVTTIKSHILQWYFINRDTDKLIDFEERYTDDNNVSFRSENRTNISFDNCTMEGSFPYYDFYLEDKEKKYILDIHLQAKTLPHWVMQEGNNGYFPWALRGIARYGFILELNTSGTITINGDKTNVTGVSYYEHAWGNFTYRYSPDSGRVLNLLDKIKEFLPLIKWYISEQKRNPSNRLKFESENFFGYDWVWGHFDNGWNIFFSAFHTGTCISEGPVFGTVALTKDGEKFYDFADVKIKYGRKIYLEYAGAYIPIDITITALKDDKKIVLNASTTTIPYNSFKYWPLSKSTCGTGYFHTAGNITGYYEDNNHKIDLNGISGMVIFRQLFTSKHKELTIKFTPRLFLSRFLQPTDLRETLVDNKNTYFSKNINYKPKTMDRSNLIYSNNPAGSNILFVGGEGSGNYSSIQAAVDNASKNDTVFVFNGSYVENIIIDKSIHLIGENKETTLIDARDNDGIKITADNVEITGFTIDSDDADNWDDSAIDISSDYNYIHHNNIVNSFWFGIFLNNCSNNTLEFNKLTNNDIGIWICRSNNNIFRFNTIELSKGPGVWLWHSSQHNYFFGNNFIENGEHVLNQDFSMGNYYRSNYWDDFKALKFGRWIDLNNDGLTFLPYNIFRLRFDRRPAVKPYQI